MHLFLLLISALPALASCPKNKKEWQKLGPKILIEKAALQHAPVEIENFSAKIGKKGATTSSAFPFHQAKGDLVMVQAKDETSSLFLSGILKCDEISHEPILLSLTYVKGDKSGLIPVISQ
jgi:hypothetical protein